MRNLFFGLLVIHLLGQPATADSPGAALALKGLDPVLLIDGKEVGGLESVQSTHGGFLYRFADSNNKAKFDARPEDFCIQFNGACGKMGPFSGTGSPERYLVHDRRIYVFASEGCRDTFRREPAKHIDIPNPPPVGSAKQLADGVDWLKRALQGFGGETKVDGVKSLQITIKNAYKGREEETLSTKRFIWAFPGRARNEEVFQKAYGHVIDHQRGFQFAGENFEPLDTHVRDYGWRQALREPIVVLRHRDARGFVAVAQGPSECDGQPVEQMAVGLDGATSIWSIDRTTGRILQARYQGRHGVVGEIVVKYGDFRGVDGVILPHQRTMSFNGKPVTSPEVRELQIVVNGDIKPDQFSKPR